MSGWSLVYDTFDPQAEGLREALCTLGNGHFAVRGAADEVDAGGPHYPGTYLAGGYNRLVSDVSGRPIENEDFVNFPNWLSVSFRHCSEPGGEPEPWFDLHAVEILAFRQELDMAGGLLHRRLRVKDSAGRVSRIESSRLVSMDQPNLAAQAWSLTPENWGGPIELRAALDGCVINGGVARYGSLRSRHLVPGAVGLESDGILHLEVETSQSRLRMVQAARLRLSRDGSPLNLAPEPDLAEGYAGARFRLVAQEGEAIELEKIVALFTGRDRAVSEPRFAALELARRVEDFARLAQRQALAWSQLWRRFDMRIANTTAAVTEEMNRILRLHVFHLLQVCSPHICDLDVGVPARGLHGEAYRGHIFWDELYIFPLLNQRLPEITRELLLYRYRRLDAARHLAREAGHAGAMYPWQSGSDGREETQQVHLNPKSGRWLPDNSQRQRHVNAAIAYNVWQYVQATDDMEFLSAYGAEMLLEIARFWASICERDGGGERWVIDGVMGPDEYHDAYPGQEDGGLRNNAYTNVMVSWLLRRAREVIDRVPFHDRDELCERLRLGDDELARWEEIANGLTLCFHEDEDGQPVISQFEGYGDLLEFDWVGYAAKYGDIQRLDRILEAEGDTPNRYKLSKQADVLMLFYLFSARELRELIEGMGYTWDDRLIERTIAYYSARTSHGSTLSRVVESWVMARIDRRRSWQLFCQALKSDVSDIQGGTTAEGIHLGAMAGTVDLVQRGYTGLELADDVLWFDPRLPDELSHLEMELRYRGHFLQIDVGRDRLRIVASNHVAKPIRIGFDGRIYDISHGEELEFALSAPSSAPKRVLRHAAG
ncbi:glycoside hydrolase family 65 protein [Algihabitans albus]|uniref:glycoside hydrolase family 65 protein n=1 Tax=Algihabitans albus TaxID=2164067 RepID=UPI000E5C6A7E|nr:glycosyl hydrolase family 65 protein [Algihabitans albus]